MTGAQKIILGIESSCDETAASVVSFGQHHPSGLILSNVVAMQTDLHAEFKGVVPEIAARAHAERILPVIRKSLRDAGIALERIDAVAVGNRPGLIGALLVGVSAAKALAWALDKPIVGVDHVHAHLFSGLLARSSPPSFPALALVVSGGHTALYRLQSPTQLARLGATIDDALGEAYDKAAAILGLPFPGGPSVDRIAASGDDQRFTLPISRLSQNSLDFSFSGLKTALLYTHRGVPPRRPRHEHEAIPVAQAFESSAASDPARIADLAASFQTAAITAIMLKIRRALDRHRDCRVLLTGGGVVANSRLRAELQTLALDTGVEVCIPPLSLCVDNAAMIAGLGFHLLEARGWTSEPLSMTASPTVAA